MSTFLHPCPSCTRHVKSTDTTCPFCTASLPPGFAPARRVKVVPHHQITRAAIAFAGVTTAMGCSSSAYGVVILDDASFSGPEDDAAGDATDAGDAGNAADAGDAGDGG
jgi:hypothetical protein